MRKVLFLFLAVASTYFFGCKSAEDITSPQDLTKAAPPAPLVWGDPDAGSTPYTVDLIQGQHEDVGDVTIEKVGNDLKITYEVVAPACQLTEIHVDLAKSTASNPLQLDFHVNSQGSPNFGNWDTKTIGTIDMTDPTSVVVTFTEAQLKEALGVTTIPSKFYIGIHGVLQCNGLGGDFCPVVAPTNTLLSFWNSDPNYYLTLNFANPEWNGLTQLFGWCLDPTRFLHTSDLPLEFHFICSYDLGTLSCLIEHPENLDAVNWLINNKGSFTKYQIQAAIWVLLSDDTNWYTLEPDYYASDYMAAVNAALQNGEGFVPSCGQKVLIIGYNQDGTDPNPCLNVTRQVVSFEVDANCVPPSYETVMGFNYPVDNTSSLFPGSKWFRYISFNY